MFFLRHSSGHLKLITELIDLKTDLMKRNNKYCPDVSIEECLSEERISENDLLKQIDETLRGCVPDIVKMMQKLEKL